jgi:DNA-binding NtrC family response regulator
MANAAPREARLLPLLGPLWVVYLAVELLTTSTALDGVSVALLVVAALGALSPRWFLRASELRPAPTSLQLDADTPTEDGRRRLSWLALCVATVAVSRAATGEPTDVGSGLLELAGSAAAPWIGALALDLAFVTPEPLARRRPGTRFEMASMARGLAYAAALVLSVLEVLRTSPALELDGVGLILVPHGAAWATLGFVWLAALGAAGVRAARRRLGSTAESLAANDWALAGLVTALAIGIAAMAALVTSSGGERGPVVRGLVAGALLAALAGHLAMTDDARPVHAARTMRALLAAALALGVAGASAVLLREGVSAHTPAIDWAVRGAGIGLLTAASYAFFRGLVDRALRPDGGRLLDAITTIEGRTVASRTLDELAAEVLPALRRAARDGAAMPRIFTLDPAREATVDAASMPHVAAREAPASLRERLETSPRAVLVAAPIIAQVVRRPDARALVATLQDLDALAVVPLSADGLEGMLVVPRGRRTHAVTLEELAALERLGRSLGARVAAWSAEARAQARAGRALLDVARREERIAALEDELADRGGGRGPHAHTPAPRPLAYASSTRAALRALEDAAPRDTPLLVIVEPGTAPEPWARRAHDCGPRAEQPLVWVDCADGSPETVEDAIFGASGRNDRPERVGALREAGRGTVVLVDVLALPAATQGRLAEAIATRTVHVGHQAHPLVCRVIATATRAFVEAATHEPADAELVRRLSAQAVRVPPLTERREDVASLILLAIERACRRRGRKLLGIEDEARAYLEEHALDDGERGLTRAVDRAVAVASGVRITRRDVERALGAPGVVVGDDPLDATLAEVEERAILRALQRAQGNKSEAARLLGLKRTTFLDKVRRLGIDDGSERPSA